MPLGGRLAERAIRYVPAPEHGCRGYKLPGKGTEQKSAVRWSSYEKRMIAKLDPISVPGQAVLLAGVSI